MLATTLKSNRPFVIIIILFLGIALWGLTLVEPIPASFIGVSAMPFYDIILKIFNNNLFLLSLFVFLLVIIQGFLLVGFNKKFILINTRTYLPALFFILISSSFIPIQEMNPLLLGGFFLFFAIDFIYRTYRADYTLNEIYLSGFCIAIAGLFWAPFFYFLILLYISLIILRTFNLREWIVAILGFLTPLFFTFVFYFVFIPEEKGIQVFNYLIKELTHIEDYITLDLPYIVFFSFLFFLIIIASFKLISGYQSRKIKTRKYFEINLWYFLLGLILFFVLKRNSLEIIFILSVPVSFLFAEYFYSIRSKTYLNIILLCIYGCLIYIQLKAHLL